MHGEGRAAYGGVGIGSGLHRGDDDALGLSIAGHADADVLLELRRVGPQLVLQPADLTRLCTNTTTTLVRTGAAMERSVLT